MPRRTAPTLAFLVLALVPVFAQRAAGQAAATRPAPAKRYVDRDRLAREARYRAMSTARLGPAMHYRLAFDAKGANFHVRVETRVTQAGALCFAMPAWAPGSYHIADYGKRLDNLHATGADGQGVEVEHPSTNVWTIARAVPGPLAVDYDIVARRFAQRGFGGRRGRRPPAYQFGGPTVWIYEVGHKDLPCRVALDLPAEWDVATGLTPVPDSLGGKVAPGRWRFTAPDYDVMIDCPAKLGRFESFGFKVGDTPFEIALAGAARIRTDRQDFARRVQRISAHFIEMFGGAPFDRYVYLFTVPGGGGLEHLNSTAIGLMSLEGSKPGRRVVWDTVIAHEFFHAWNVKRLRPRALGPFDYTGPDRTTALWFAEGVTSYYGNLAMPRVGLWDAHDYWRHLGGRFSSLRRDPRRKRMSVADSSWAVWDGRYMGSRDRVDYYLKGECLGALLDILIREATANEGSLDDVMRGLTAQTREAGSGFAEGDIRLWCEKVSGRSFGRFFARYVYGTDDLPFEAVLPKAGLVVETSGDKKKPRYRLAEDPKASPLARAIRAGLVGPWK